MSRAINVKVATPKVIKSLEDKLKQVKENKANEKLNQDKYDKAYKKWQDSVIKIMASHTGKASQARVNKRYDGSLNIDLYFNAGIADIPDEPQREYEFMVDWKYQETVEELENAIRILKMTDEEYVSTSTFKSIAKYL